MDTNRCAICAHKTPLSIQYSFYSARKMNFERGLYVEIKKTMATSQPRGQKFGAVREEMSPCLGLIAILLLG